MLPPTLVEAELKFYNQRLKGKPGVIDEPGAEGELMRFKGYMSALAFHPDEAISEMWREKQHAKARDILPPPAMGRHGMDKNRFMKIKSILGEFWDVDDVLA
eukprot:4106132-Pleurochrysis_carterae.AAC.1